ncbi:MAG TPA: tetratricopeptide repeat protein [Candidatus Poseidoniaceae archaeon]|nr:tetratricopeptide repeat protein [Candidatus Poseidoniaceae archaeon]|tara:strand:- start:3111 stop:5282 length:2172 start_codon:yes stop_codon:yes gene_type:complete
MDQLTDKEQESNDDNVVNQVESLLISGEEASRSGDSKTALAAFNKAISLDPSSDMAWFNRGVLLEAQQDARGARQAFQICLDVNPNHAPATANLCILLERIGDQVGAYSMALKALEFYPGHPTIMDVKNRCQGSASTKPLESMQAVEQIESFDQEDVETVVQETGISDVNALLDEAVHHDADDNQQLDIEELRSAAEVVIATEDIKDRIEVSQPVVQAIPDLPVVPIETEMDNVLDLDNMANEAKNLIQSGDAKGALALLKPHLKNEASKHPQSWLIAGGAMARLDLQDHAISAIEHAQKLDPSNPKGWYNLGSLKQRKGLLKEASTCYSNALREDPSYVKAAQKWAPLAMELKDPEAYLSAATIIIAADPESPVRLELATTLIELAEGESRVLELQAGIPPTLPEGPEMAKTALDLLGQGDTKLHARAHTMANNHMESVKIWKGLIQSERNDPETWRGLSKALYAAGDNTTAEKCSIKAKEIEEELAKRGGGVVAPDISSATSSTETQQDNAAMQIPQTNQIVEQPVEVNQEQMMSANELLSRPQIEQPVPETTPNPEVDLAKAALEVQSSSLVQEEFRNPESNAVANQDISWYNQGVALIEAGKYAEALSCFDRALPSFADDDEMVIRILNGRGNAFYYLENYPACVESYHQAMLIKPEEVRGKTLYNMGTAYAEMERYQDSVKCFEQAIPRGLSKEEIKRTKDQIRRCNILIKEQNKKKR